MGGLRSSGEGMVWVLRTCPETTMRICFDDEREGGADIAFLNSNRAEAVRVRHVSHWRPQIAGRAGQSRAEQIQPSPDFWRAH
jgi:hypothetical protein